MNEQISTIQTREVIELMRNLAPILNQKELFEFMLFSNRVVERYMPEHYNDGLSEEVTEMRKDKAWLKEELMGLKFKISEIGKVRLGEVFELVDQLDEPEKVVVPSFIADYIERAKPRHDSLYQAMEERAGEEVNEWIQAFYNSDKFARAWLYGYEVEKEKKWVVKQRKLYLKSFDIWREECNNAEFVFDKESTIKFTDKVKAEAVALLVDGTVEEEAE